MGILCQRCKQTNATVHLTDIQPDGEPVERHLCEECAAQEGVTMKPSEPINQMLDKFVKNAAVMQQASQQACPKCGITFGEFRADGLLGCAHDYEAFADLLIPLIQRAHNGATAHSGKSPRPTDERGRRLAELARLRRELDEAVASENYETAARRRDELKRLEAEGRS